MGRAIIRQADAFCSMSRCRTWTPSSAARCAPRSPGSNAAWASPPSTSPTTRPSDDARRPDRGPARRPDATDRNPHDLYHKPANMFWPGSRLPPMNFIPGAAADTIETPFGEVALTADRLQAIAGRGLVILGIRPQHFEDLALVDAADRGRGQTLTATVDVTECSGRALRLHSLRRTRRRLQKTQRPPTRTPQRTTPHTTSGIPARRQQSPRRHRNRTLVDTEQVDLFDPATGENLTRYPD